LKNASTEELKGGSIIVVDILRYLKDDMFTHPKKNKIIACVNCVLVHVQF